MERLREGRRRGFVLSLIAFLLMGAVLFLSSELALSGLRQYDQFGQTTQLLEASDTIQILTETLSRNDIVPGFDASFSGNTTSLTDAFPYPALPEQELLDRVDFIRNRSRFDISVNISSGAPGIVSIYPQRLYVLHPDKDSMSIVPENDQNGTAVKEIILRLEMSLEENATYPQPEWAENNSVPSDSPDAIHVSAVGFNANGSMNQTLDDYVNRSLVNRLVFTTPYGNVTYAAIGNGTIGRLDVTNMLNASSPYIANATLYTNVTADSQVESLYFGPVLCNASVSLGDSIRIARHLGSPD